MARATKKRKDPGPSAAEVEAILTKYDKDFLDCRELHQWVQVGYYYDAEGDIRRLWRCTRCTARKRNRMSADGSYVSPTVYKHPAGYKIARVKPYQVRGEAIRRAKIYSSEQMMFTKTGFNNGNGKAKKTLTHTAAHKRKTKVSA